MEYAQFLQKLMDLKGYTKYRLAKEIPCSASSVANWLSGTEPTPIMKVRILEILGELPPEETEKSPAPTFEGEAQTEQFIAAYRAAPRWLQDQVLALLKAAESGGGAPGAGSTDQ